MDESKRLRVLLDERGIEHKDNDTPINGVTSYMTTWHCTNGKLVSFIETEIPHATKLRIYNPTPKQAIAATVGGYAITFAPTLDRPPETMVGETVYDSEGNAVGWIVNATVGVGTCRNAVMCNVIDCEYNHKCRCTCGDLEIQDQECMTYRCRDIDYDEEEE